MGFQDMRKFLTECRKIENIAGDLYQRLSENKSYHGKVREVFQQLAKDEKAHARHIDLILQASEQEIDVTEMIAGEKLQEALTLAERMVQTVGQEALNEENALRLAVLMEQQFMKVHVNNALFFRNQKLAELFNKLGSEDEAHMDTLKACLKWWHAERKPVLKEN
jgi:rubrerythrin